VTLVIAMMVMGVVASLSVVVVGVAITTNQESGRDRQRTVTINAAEGGVDAVYAAVQSSGTSLPCRWPASGTSAVNAAPDQATSYATVGYFDAVGAPLTCTAGTLNALSIKPATAVVDGYGTAQPIAGQPTSQRRMQALINLNPVYGDSLNKAIFANSTLTFDNQTTLTGNRGPDADIYTNGNYTCANNQNFAGSIIAQGSLTVQGACTIAGDAWARLSIANSAGSSGSIGGRALSSAGGISLPDNFAVNGTLLAASDIAWRGCSASGKCFPRTSSVAAPPVYPFPILRGDSATLAKWSEQGYNAVTYTGPCSDLVQRIKDTYSKANGQKTLVKTSCAVNFDNDRDIVLQNNLAIFSTGGFSSRNQVSFGSSDASARVLHWVVPYEAAPSLPCTSPGITTDQQFNFTAAVNMLVYSPCNISFSNNSDHMGQIIGGSNVSITNQFSMKFRPVPLWGIDPTSLPLLSYQIDVVYKRETR
jgi:Tfp pilus assembly protein PilX